MKRPAFQFYPGDWRTDPGLRLCSIGARGLWIEMMCLMHEGEPYGHLTVQGRVIEPQSLARLVSESVPAVKRWMAELRENEVFSTTDDGVIFSRRMVRDEGIREARAAGGKQGASHGHKGGSHGSKGGRPKKQETPQELNGRGVILPPPSSSSSSPSSPSGSSEDKSSAENSDQDFWASAKTYLEPESKNPGALVGKWVRDYGKTDTAAAITRAQIERPVQRIPFIEGCFRQRVREAAEGPLC